MCQKNIDIILNEENRQVIHPVCLILFLTFLPFQFWCSQSKAFWLGRKQQSSKRTNCQSMNMSHFPCSTAKRHWVSLTSLTVVTLTLKISSARTGGSMTSGTRACAASRLSRRRCLRATSPSTSRAFRRRWRRTAWRSPSRASRPLLSSGRVRGEGVA